jgi:hypothetical protein
MKLRSFLFILAAGVLLLLSLAGGSFYWVLAQSPLNLLGGGIDKTPTAAMFVAKQSPVMVSLLVNPDRLEAFRELAAPLGERRRAIAEIDQLKQNLLAKTGLNYRKDIQPWLGDEMTLAVTSLDFDRNRENGTQPGYLLVLSTKDGELAREFLQLSYSKQAIAGTFDLVFEQYQGVNVIYKRYLQSQPNSNLLASAVVDNFVIFANDPKVLREAINNVQVQEGNLENTESYQEALKTIVAPRIGVAFINLPSLSAWLGDRPEPETADIEQTIAVALSLQPEGLSARTALIGVAGEANQKPSLSEPVGALAYVPSESILTAAGSDLNQFWTQIATGLEFDSPLQQLLQKSLLRLQEPWGIDFTENIFPWVKGEYAIALLSNPKTNQLDWVFAAEKRADANAEAAIDRLDEIAKTQGLSVGSLPLKEKEITAWTKLSTEAKNSLVSLDAKVKGAHLDLGKYEIFATSIEALSQAIEGGEESLAGSDKFSQAIAALPRENDGYFYIDWLQSEALVQKKVPLIKVVELAGQPLFNHLRSLVLSSQGSENGIRRATIFFKLE